MTAAATATVTAIATAAAAVVVIGFVCSLHITDFTRVSVCMCLCHFGSLGECECEYVRLASF